MAAKKTGVPPAVVAVVRAWAKARSADGDRVLKDGRLTLDPLLLPLLVEEVAEITAEQLLIALDMPPKEPPQKEEKPVPFLGMELSQEQGKRAAQWLADQAGIAEALGLSVDAWSQRLQSGFQRTLEALRGKPLGALAETVAQNLGGDPLASASKGFTGTADPRTSEKAGLRGVLAARDWKKK